MKKLIAFLVLAVAACNGVNTPTSIPSALPPTAISMTETTLPATGDASTSTPSSIPSIEAPTSTTTFPDPNAYAWEQLPIANLERPVDLQPDGSGRLFVIEKAGRIRILEKDQLLEAPFLDITDRVGSEGNEQGLLGLAFHPQYQENGRFFV